MPFPFVSRAVYDAERARSERLEARVAELTDAMLRMRQGGFTPAAPLPETVPQPVEPEQQALEQLERPVVEPIAELIRSERPDVTPAMAYKEARRIAQEIGLGG